MADQVTADKGLADKSAADAAPTGIVGRWYILLLISVMYLITYLDRVNISTAAPVISKEFGFDKVTMGVIFSAFVWAYALFQVPGGWLSDRFGARSVLTGVVAYWSIMTAATAGAFSAGLVHGRALPVRHRRGRRVPGRHPRDAALVPAERTRLCAGHHPQREPPRRRHRAADRGPDHD